MKVEESMLLYLGRTSRWNFVTTPGKPGPEPLAAQKRSELCLESQRTRSPLAVTTSTARTFSQAQPQFLQFHPIPPCKRNPPSPTSGQWPPANIRPFLSRNPLSMRPVVLGETETVLRDSSRSIRWYFPRSIKIASSRTLHAAQLWPPDLTETLQPRSTARRTASTMCDSSVASTTAIG